MSNDSASRKTREDSPPLNRKYISKEVSLNLNSSHHHCRELSGAKPLTQRIATPWKETRFNGYQTGPERPRQSRIRRDTFILHGFFGSGKEISFYVQWAD